MTDRLYRPAKSTHKSPRIITRHGFPNRCMIRREQDEKVCSTCGIRTSAENSDDEIKRNCPRKKK